MVKNGIFTEPYTILYLVYSFILSLEPEIYINLYKKIQTYTFSSMVTYPTESFRKRFAWLAAIQLKISNLGFVFILLSWETLNQRLIHIMIEILHKTKRLPCNINTPIAINKSLPKHLFLQGLNCFIFILNHYYKKTKLFNVIIEISFHFTILLFVFD